MQGRACTPDLGEGLAALEGDHPEGNQGHVPATAPSASQLTLPHDSAAARLTLGSAPTGPSCAAAAAAEALGW